MSWFDVNGTEVRRLLEVDETRLERWYSASPFELLSVYRTASLDQLWDTLASRARSDHDAREAHLLEMMTRQEEIAELYGHRDALAVELQGVELPVTKRADWPAFRVQVEEALGPDASDAVRVLVEFESKDGPALVADLTGVIDRSAGALHASVRRELMMLTGSTLALAVAGFNQHFVSGTVPARPSATFHDEVKAGLDLAGRQVWQALVSQDLVAASRLALELARLASGQLEEALTHVAAVAKKRRTLGSSSGGAVEDLLKAMVARLGPNPTVDDLRAAASLANDGRLAGELAGELARLGSSPTLEALTHIGASRVDDGRLALQLSALMGELLRAITVGWYVAWLAKGHASQEAVRLWSSAAKRLPFLAVQSAPGTVELSTLAGRPDGDLVSIEGIVGAMDLLDPNDVATASIFDGQGGTVDIFSGEARLDTRGMSPGAYVQVSGRWQSASSEVNGPALLVEKVKPSDPGNASWYDWVADQMRLISEITAPDLAAQCSWEPGDDGAANMLQYGVWQVS